MKHALFVCFDDSFWRYARACLNSLRANYPDHPPLVVIYPGEDPAVLSFLDRFGVAERMDQGELLERTAGLPLGPVGNPIVYARYLLWSDAFDDYDKVLHLDADTLVQRPLDELFEYDDFFAVANHCRYDGVTLFNPEYEQDPTLHDLLREDGLAYPGGMDDMINAGVFVIPVRYRTAAQLDRLLKVTKRYAPYLNYADQSAISLWCHLNGIRPREDYSFNFQTPFVTTEDITLAPEQAHILHFSDRKPDQDDFLDWRAAGDRAPWLQARFERYA